MLETSKKRCLTVIQRSRDLRPLSRDLQWLFSKFLRIAWNVKKTLFESHTMVAWPPTTVAWPSVTFFKIFPNILKRLKTLFDSHTTVAWPPTTVAWPSVTFFKIFPNCLKRLKNVVWQSSNGRVTSDHCRVTISDFFQKISELLETSKKRCLTVIQRSRDLRPVSRDRSVTFFQKFSELLETSKKRCLTVIQRLRDLRPLSRDLQWLFSKIFWIAWNVQKTLFDSHPTVAWPPTTVAWPSVTFFKIFPICLKRLKNVVWQSSNGRVTSDHCRVTFSDFFQNFSELLETSKKRCLTVIQRSRDLRPLLRDLQWLFSKKFPNRLKRLKTLFDSRPTVAWPLTTIAWPFSDFFQNFAILV